MSLYLISGAAITLAYMSHPVQLLALVLFRHRPLAKLFQTAIHALGLLRHSHLFVQCLACFPARASAHPFPTVDRHVIVAAHARIDKLQIDVVANPLEIPVVPGLEWKRRRIASAFVHRPLVASAARVRINAVWLAVSDIDAAPVGPPPRLACGKVLVGISNPRVVLFAILILRRIRVGIPPQPEVSMN